MKSLLFFDDNRQKGDRERRSGRKRRGRLDPIARRERPPPVNDPIKFRAIVIRMGQVVLHK